MELDLIDSSVFIRRSAGRLPDNLILHRLPMLHPMFSFTHDGKRIKSPNKWRNRNCCIASSGCSVISRCAAGHRQDLRAEGPPFTWSILTLLKHRGSLLPRAVNQVLRCGTCCWMEELDPAHEGLSLTRISVLPVLKGDVIK